MFHNSDAIVLSSVRSTRGLLSGHPSNVSVLSKTAETLQVSELGRERLGKSDPTRAPSAQISDSPSERGESATR